MNEAFVEMKQVELVELIELVHVKDNRFCIPKRPQNQTTFASVQNRQAAPKPNDIRKRPK